MCMTYMYLGLGLLVCVTQSEPANRVSELLAFFHSVGENRESLLPTTDTPTAGYLILGYQD